MKNKSKVVVCSRSFSKNKVLQSELLTKYENVKFNSKGLKLKDLTLINFIEDAEKIIVGLEKIDKKLLNSSKNLKVISKFGVGSDSLDMKLINDKGIKLSITPGTNSRSVSELVLSLAINLYRDLKTVNTNTTNGIWTQNKGRLISGKRFGIIGCNHVGKDLVKLLKPFNCQILVNDIYEDKEFNKAHNIEFMSIENLLKISEIITIHVPYNESTKNILNSERLELINNNAILINTARGGLVDEKKLKKLLVNKDILAAAFDVFENEPPLDKELINLENFFATSHIGGSTEEAIISMGRAAIEGLDLNN